jgi:ATP phosphoribosyltransferase regulatory subunit
MWDLLDVAGVSGRVAADFGTLRSFDYYSGIVLEAYAPGLGLPLGGGGRYDGLLARFGSDRPAAGFALGIERVHIALAEQGVAIELPAVETAPAAQALWAATGQASKGGAA